MPAADREHSEFVYYIAANGYTADLFNQHVRTVAGTKCEECGKCWPCNMRQVAEQALRLLERRPGLISGRSVASAGPVVSVRTSEAYEQLSPATPPPERCRG
jgi:hypothetical protein